MKKVIFIIVAAAVLWAAPIDDAVKKLGVQLDGTVAHKGAQSDKTGVTLQQFEVSDEEAVLSAKTVRFEGADPAKKADLLAARRIVMEEGRFTDQNGSVITFKKLTLEAADLAGFFQVMNSSWGQWQQVVELSGLKLLEIEGVSAVLEKGFEPLQMKRFVIDGTRFKAGRLEASRYQMIGLNLPLKLMADLEGEPMPPQPGQPPQQTFSELLAELGYKNLLIDWKDDSSVEGEGIARKMSGRQKLAIDKMGELNFEFKLSNVPENLSQLFMQENSTPQEAAAMMSIKLDHVSLSYTDKGLLPKLYAVKGPKEKLDGAAYAKKQAKEFRESMAAVQRPILSAKEIDAMARFLEKPGTLTLSAHPKDGAMLMEIVMLYAADWRLLMERLALKVEAAR